MKVLASITQLHSLGLPTGGLFGGVMLLPEKSCWRALCVGGSPARQCQQSARALQVRSVAFTACGGRFFGDFAESFLEPFLPLEVERSK